MTCQDCYASDWEARPEQCPGCGLVLCEDCFAYHAGDPWPEHVRRTAAGGGGADADFEELALDAQRWMFDTQLRLVVGTALTDAEIGETVPVAARGSVIELEAGDRVLAGEVLMVDPGGRVRPATRGGYHVNAPARSVAVSAVTGLSYIAENGETVHVTSFQQLLDALMAGRFELPEAIGIVLEAVAVGLTSGAVEPTAELETWLRQHAGFAVEFDHG